MGMSFDERFRQMPWRYLFQSLLAGAAIAVIMSLHVFVESPALLASLGSSAFLAFTVPHSLLSGPRRLVGGYLCGAAVGVVGQLLLDVGWLPAAGLDETVARTIVAGLGVGAAMLLMVVMDMEHAPAAGITLGLVLGAHVPDSIVCVVAGIIVLSIIKRLLRPILIDLL